MCKFLQGTGRRVLPRLAPVLFAFFTDVRADDSLVELTRPRCTHSPHCKIAGVAIDQQQLLTSCGHTKVSADYFTVADSLAAASAAAAAFNAASLAAFAAAEREPRPESRLN